MNANFTAKTQALSLLGLIILNCSGSLLKTFILIVVIIRSNTVQTQFKHSSVTRHAYLATASLRL